MAFTQVRVRRTVIGNMVMEIWTCTFTGVTSGNLVTGMSNIEAPMIVCDTTRDGATNDHTSTPGTVAMASYTSGDVATVTVMGRSKK